MMDSIIAFHQRVNTDGTDMPEYLPGMLRGLKRGNQQN